MLPFNIELMGLTKDKLSKLKPVRSLDIYDGGSTNFHEDGLFSVSIFGRVGSEQRDIMFSYIDIKVSILHPLIYSTLTRLKGMYKGILSGTTYADWDETLKDFIPSNELDGKTGYAFFMQHWQDIEFRQTKSVTRKQRIALIEKFKDRATVDKILVIPAGIRDLHVDENGRQVEDEINSLYRRVLSIANTIGVTGERANSPVLDNARHSLQMTFNDIYEMLENLLKDKRGFVQKKWGSRRVFNGTRNVITAMDTSVSELGVANSPKLNDTIAGLYQVAKGALPLTKHLLLNGYLSKVFGQADGKAILVDTKTLKPEYVEVDPETFDRWYTPEGLERVLNSYSEVSVRDKPILVNDRYLGLIYIGSSDSNFRIFNNIEDLPSHLKRKDVYPLTLCQLLYLSGYTKWNDLRAFVTRYPIGQGKSSIYPSSVYVKTTTTGEMRWELDENWERIGDTRVALEFPQVGSNVHVDAMSPHSSRLEGLTAD